MFPVLVSVALFGQTIPSGSELFARRTSTGGVVVIILFFTALFAAGVFALVGYIRQRRREELPTILGDPKGLLDEAGAVVELSTTDRYLLSKLAQCLRLPQPTSILLSPELLVQAADTWRRSHHIGPAREWGLRRLNGLAKVIYGNDLTHLAQSSNEV